MLGKTGIKWKQSVMEDREVSSREHRNVTTPRPLLLMLLLIASLGTTAH
jgi:hypothetical protein